MNIERLKKLLISSVGSGLLNKYEKVKASLADDGFYAYTLYCTSGFNAFCIAASTEKSLFQVKIRIKEAEKDLFDLIKEDPEMLEQFSYSSDLYAEMTACEWEYIYSDIAEFDKLDSVVNDIYEYGDEEAEEDFDVSQFLASCIIEGIEEFKNSSLFDKGILMGLQFSDPSEHEIQILEIISSQVNDVNWHQKILDLYNEETNT